MDYLVALLLARYVDERYWDIVEKTARNHLDESQVRDGSWLSEEPKLPDEDGVIRSDIRQRVVGSFAGWSAPHALLAYEEELGSHWVRTEEMKPRYLGKIRALQNCCAGRDRAIHILSNSHVQEYVECEHAHQITNSRARITMLHPLRPPVWSLSRLVFGSRVDPRSTPRRSI